MPVKKQNFTDDEEQIGRDAVIYKRGDYWHFRMWLAKERKYARFSLKTQNKATAIDKAEQKYYELKVLEKAGKTYYSKTCKHGAESYLENRSKYIGKNITKGRYGTIKTHLEHWLDFIKRDTKLKELARTDCEEYFLSRTKTRRRLEISVTTVANEQATINAMIGWLFKKGETYIEKFDFPPLPKRDKNDSRIIRQTLTREEVDDIRNVIDSYILEEGLSDKEAQNRTLSCYYILISSVTGMRTGELRQLKWGDIKWTREFRKKKGIGITKIRVRWDTSKTRNSRELMVADNDYFEKLSDYITRINEKPTENDSFVFSINGKDVVSKRSVYYHFYKLIELAKIDIEDRNIVPYSLRHYFITQKLNSGIKIEDVADDCGTSPKQIFDTYYHKQEHVMRKNAVDGYDFDSDDEENEE